MPRFAPVVKEKSLEEAFSEKDAVWKKNVSRLEELERAFKEKQPRCSTVEYGRAMDELAHQRMVTDFAHDEMVAALTVLERAQYLNGQMWELQDRKQKLGILKESIEACDVELSELTAIEQSIPLKRLRIVGKRQSLWNEFAAIQEEIRRVENAHS